MLLKVTMLISEKYKIIFSKNLLGTLMYGVLHILRSGHTIWIKFKNTAKKTSDTTNYESKIDCIFSLKV